MSHAGIQNFGSYESYLLSVLEPSAPPTRRVVVRCRGYTIKLFQVQDGFVEWRIVNKLGVRYPCQTSFWSYEGALQDARRSIDAIVRHETMPKYKLPLAVLMRMP